MRPSGFRGLPGEIFGNRPRETPKEGVHDGACGAVDLRSGWLMRSPRRPIPLTLTTCCLCALAAVAAWLSVEDSRTYAVDGPDQPVVQAIAPRTVVAGVPAEANAPLEAAGWSEERLRSLLSEGVRVVARLAGWRDESQRTAAIASERAATPASDERPVS